MKIIDTALSNYRALPPAGQKRVRAACGSIGFFLLFLLFIAQSEDWRKALGIFLSVALFITVAAFATWLGTALGKVFGQKAGTAFGVRIIFAFIGLVRYVIGANWG